MVADTIYSRLVYSLLESGVQIEPEDMQRMARQLAASALMFEHHMHDIQRELASTPVGEQREFLIKVARGLA